MADGSHRAFSFDVAKREQVPLLVGLSGPSGSGKTFTALRLAKGMQRVKPGPILFIDTENRRGLHYADKFDFRHADFGAPFGSLDYLAALQQAAKLDPAAIVVDSMSHEHEGPGGMVDAHDKILADRVARAKERGDRRPEWQLAEAQNMLAWQEPKAARRALLQGITRLNTNVIMCFRAGEKVKPGKNEKGKTEVVEQGFTAIAGDEFVYEMTVCALFKPGARGVPTWESEKPGEKKAVKLPGQFEGLFRDGCQIDESHGEAMAQWAKGEAKARDRADNNDLDALFLAGDDAAARGSEALGNWWQSLTRNEKALLVPKKDDPENGWKARAAIADAANRAMAEEIPL